MECIISIFLLIAVICLVISVGIDLIFKVKRIIEERKLKKEIKRIDRELDKVLNKIFDDITNKIIADNMKKKTDETKNKTTTRKRKQSDKKED